MQILLLSDIHGHTEPLSKLAGAIAEADLVCLCGDLTHFRGAADAMSIIKALNKPMEAILAVSGNCDEKGVEGALTDAGPGIHGRVKEVAEFSFVGLGGSLITPFRTPNEYRESELAATLTGAMDCHTKERPLVLVSHQPPLGSCADRLSNGDHVGSHAVNDFIESRRPLACLTGHIHESHGIERVNETLIVNPGALSQGRYAQIFITKKGAEAELGTL